MIDLDDLERKAKEATPGPWAYGPYHRDSSYYDVSTADYSKTICGDGGCFEEDAEFIAAANPAVVLELIKAARKLRELESAMDDCFDQCPLCQFEEGHGMECPRLAV